jgi:catalase
LTDLPASPALSILENGPDSFAGRKIGVLITEGFDRAILDELRRACDVLHVDIAVIAPAVDGVKDAEGSIEAADEMLGGGPSVLYDAVVLLVAGGEGDALAKDPAAKQFVSDAYAHCKFIGYTEPAKRLFEQAGVPGGLDDGFLPLKHGSQVATFLERCRELRFWQRGTL